MGLVLGRAGISARVAVADRPNTRRFHRAAQRTTWNGIGCFNSEFDAVAEIAEQCHGGKPSRRKPDAQGTSA